MKFFLLTLALVAGVMADVSELGYDYNPPAPVHEPEHTYLPPSAPAPVQEYHPAPAPVYHPAPAPVHHHAPAPVHHHAPAPVHHHAPAPVHHHAPAPAPVYHPAPAPVNTYIPPAPVHHPAPAPVHHHAPAPAPVYHPAPAPVHHHAPAPVHHHAPAPVHHHAPAPVHHHAPAPVHHHVPAPVNTYIPPAPVHHPAPAPAPVYHPAPAPVYHPAPAPAPVNTYIPPAVGGSVELGEDGYTYKTARRVVRRRFFRVNGPKAHRKMDLAQYPPRPIGSPDDPLADPFDDPSYSFSFRTAEQSRSEDNDATGRVRGLYSFLDDEGERHSVRYAAGAGTGFEVSNAVPDNPASVGYANPLYKAPPGTRGKMSVQRGPDGTYKLIAAGPDHRRAESRTPDGLVRGTYSFLDDKGVQRTVEYIAGAGIGYRVVQNRIGPSTHINPSVADFRLGDTNFKLANDFGAGAGEGAALGGGGSTGGGRRGEGGSGGRIRGGGSRVKGGSGNGAGGEYATSDARKVPSRGGGGDRDDNGDNEITHGRDYDDDGDFDDNSGRSNNKMKADRMGTANRGRGGTRYRGGASSSDDDLLEREPMSERDNPKVSIRPGTRPSGNRNTIDGDKRGGTRNRVSQTNRDRTGSNGGIGGGAGAGSSVGGGGYSYEPPSKGSASKNNYDPNNDDIGTSLPPLITANRKILEIDRERDWVERHRDSTVIKNVGNWYIGLPPGHSVRAHVQNIDILPLGGRRVPSPSEALRQDELADMVASLESEKLTYNS